jgi:hypothetical protein
LPKPPRKSEVAASPQDLVPPQDITVEKPADINASYNRVARKAKLVGLTLKSSNFFCSSEYFTAKDSETPPKLGYSSKMFDPAFSDERGVAKCEWKWCVSARAGRKKVLTIESTYLLIYENLEECEAAAVNRFMLRVGRFASYPYFRAHVSQISWESAAELPILPTIAT